MQIVLYFVLFLFALKLMYNLAVPYAGTIAANRNAAGQSVGVSLMPAVEFLLLMVSVLCAAVSSAVWPSAWSVFTYGLAAIVLSYVHLPLAGFLLGWWLSGKTERKTEK